MIDDAEIDDGSEIVEQPKYTPDQLMQKMATSAWLFEKNAKFCHDNFRYYQRRIQKARVLILARRFDLIQNEKLRAHLELVFADPRYKPTKEDIAGFVYVETLDISEVYEKAELTAKLAEREHEMWSKQLGWYQSEIKKQHAEAMALNMQT